MLFLNNFSYSYCLGNCAIVFFDALTLPSSQERALCNEMPLERTSRDAKKELGEVKVHSIECTRHTYRFLRDFYKSLWWTGVCWSGIFQILWRVSCGDRRQLTSSSSSRLAIRPGSESGLGTNPEGLQDEAGDGSGLRRSSQGTARASRELRTHFLHARLREGVSGVATDCLTMMPCNDASPVRSPRKPVPNSSVKTFFFFYTTPSLVFTFLLNHSLA